MKDPALIDQLLSKGKEANEKVKNSFTDLSTEQLNWKPADHKWSIGQCLDHLVISNCAYFPVFNNIISGNHKMTFWEKWSPFTGFWGHVLAEQMQEKAKKKLNAPKIFLPDEHRINAGILERFYKHQDSLLNYMDKCRHIDIDKTHISSPVSKFITYNLRKTFLILIPHEHRHINQAIALKSAKNFPAGSG